MNQFMVCLYYAVCSCAISCTLVFNISYMQHIYITDANVSNSKVSGKPGSTAAFNNVLYGAHLATPQSSKVK